MKTLTLVAVLFVGSVAQAQQPGPKPLQIGMYAPTALFADSAARLAYVQGLARAVAAKIGQPVEGKAYIRYDDLYKAKPDFAIVPAQCIVAKPGGTLLANASIGGETIQRWALFARGSESIASLKGKKLAIVKTGCRDDDFIENAMFESEVQTKYFGALVDRPDVAGAVAAVKDFKQADAVFAPANAGKGLTKLFDAGGVPTPAFVVVDKGLPGATVEKVKDAVLSYGAGGGIDGWKGASQAAYDGLRSRMAARVKRGVFALPDVVRIEDDDVLVVPESETEQASVKQHFWEPK